MKRRGLSSLLANIKGQCEKQLNDQLPKTRISLLNRLRVSPNDAGSWTEFVNIYGSRINLWCRGWGLQPNDAEDVTQNVMVAMAKQMRDFEYDTNGRFRSWLKTIAHRAWVDYLKNRKRAAVGSGSDEVQSMLNSIETAEDFVSNIMTECEKGLLEEAMVVVRRRVNDNTWKAFHMTAIENIPAPSVAAQLDMAITAVYKAKSRIQQLLKDEMEKLDESFSD